LLPDEAANLAGQPTGLYLLLASRPGFAELDGSLPAHGWPGKGRPPPQ